MPVDLERRADDEAVGGVADHPSVWVRLLRDLGVLIEILHCVFTDKKTYKFAVFVATSALTIWLLVNMITLTDNMNQITQPDPFWKNSRRLARKTARAATEGLYSSSLNSVLTWLTAHGGEKDDNTNMDSGGSGYKDNEENCTAQKYEGGGDTLTIFDYGEEGVGGGDNLGQKLEDEQREEANERRSIDSDPSSM